MACVVLMGFSTSGKSTLGKRLAQEFGDQIAINERFTTNAATARSCGLQPADSVRHVTSTANAVADRSGLIVSEPQIQASLPTHSRRENVFGSPATGRSLWLLGPHSRSMTLDVGSFSMLCDSPRMRRKRVAAGFSRQTAYAMSPRPRMRSQIVLG